MGLLIRRGIESRELRGYVRRVVVFMLATTVGFNARLVALVSDEVTLCTKHTHFFFFLCADGERDWCGGRGVAPAEDVN